MPFVVDPQVAGELGAGTEMDTSTHPPVVHRLEYVLDYPGTDDLIQSFPVYLASDTLRDALTDDGISGIIWKNAQVSRSASYDDYPPADRVHYTWLVPGMPGDDCWVEDSQLIVSDKMMDVLRKARLEDCAVEELT